METFLGKFYPIEKAKFQDFDGDFRDMCNLSSITLDKDEFVLETYSNEYGKLVSGFW